MHDNAAGFEGGGVFVESLSSVSVLSSKFANNIAKGDGGGIFSKYCTSIEIGRSIIIENVAGQGGGIFIEDVLEDALIEDTRIIGNLAIDGGGGGILWERTAPKTIGNVVIEGNMAQYGNNIGSGIAFLTTTIGNEAVATNFDPILPEIRVSIMDHYGSLVKRRNQATTVVATVFSSRCMYATKTCNERAEYDGVPTCHTCPTLAQSLFGKPAQEIPGLDGTVNFTGLGIRAWPGNHTLRLEIDRIKPLYRKVAIKDCVPGQFLLTRDDVDGGQCTTCPSGYHKSEPGIKPCAGCVAGFACQSGSINAVSCPGKWRKILCFSALGQVMERGARLLPLPWPCFHLGVSW